eukprot:Clim_evm50s99 gene=Clim_evmTU50s99
MEEGDWNLAVHSSPYNEVGFGCIRQRAKHDDGWGYVQEQVTEACMSGTVTRAFFLEVGFSEKDGDKITHEAVLEEGYYDHGVGFTIGADYDKYGNVIMRSLIEYVKWNKEAVYYRPFQTTYLGYGAFRTDKREDHFTADNSSPDAFAAVAVELADWFASQSPPPPPPASVAATTTGPGNLRLYRNGAWMNAPKPWIMDSCTTILLTSDPLKTSSNGYVAFAEPGPKGQFLSWAGGITGDHTITVTMNAEDPWLTDSVVHAIFEEAQETNAFVIDHSQSNFWGNGVRSQNTIPGYPNWWQLDVFKMTITPTGKVTDLDLYLDGSGSDGWPNENIYNPAGVYDAAKNIITLTMGTDRGPILIALQGE